MIEVANLTKRYGAFTAVDDVSFVCKPGAVTGFLGPNGAGKTTTMRIIAGLTTADSGTATVGGVPYTAVPNPGRQIGVLLDASAQHNGRTGKEILTLAAMTMGLPASRVEEMLAVVGLSGPESKRRVRNYSLGMRQRLGIAAALLGDPKILILDEPANGLDPAGIHWMRTLLRSYADRGGTVLLSSHLLHEIEVIADELIVIGQGRIIAQGTKDELLAASGATVRSVNDALLATALGNAGYTATSASAGGLSVDAEPEQVGQVAAATGIALIDLRPTESGGLEEMFLQLTTGSQRDAVPSEGVRP